MKMKKDYVTIILTRYGYIKRMPVSVYVTQGRGGIGRKAIGLGDLDVVETIIAAHIQDHLVLFSSIGKAYHLEVSDIPEAPMNDKGKSLLKLVNISRSERITHLLPISNPRAKDFVALATEYGIIKRMPLIFYRNIRKSGIVVIGLKEDDNLRDVTYVDHIGDICLFTVNGQGLRFSMNQARPTGRNAIGVRGIGLHKRDRLAGITVAEKGASVLLITNNGYGKRLSFDELRPFTKRGARGIRVITSSERAGHVVAVKRVRDKDHAVVVTRQGVSISLNCKRISLQKRASFGVRLISMTEQDEVAGMAIVPSAET
ncbi:hypothetical protein JXM67_08220 [candidate division WOR-3 bacterium]|nr:hypothetical protein [candidate division WOR-3 bacterium]